MKSLTNRIQLNLRTLRRLCNYTQQEVAEKLFISRSAYSKIESGITTPTMPIMSKLAEIYDVPICEILDESNTGLVFYFKIVLEHGEEKIIQLARTDFPKKPKFVSDEWDALEFIKQKLKAIDGEILCFTFDGYDALDMQNLR